MASRLQDVILRGLAASRPLATAVAPGTLYYSTDTATTDRSDGTIWETYADTGGGGGAPAAHAPSHLDGGSDEVDVKLLGGFPANSALFLNGAGSFSVPPTGAAHAITHASAGSDPVVIGSLAGFPGTTTTFLRGDGTFSALPASAVRYGLIGLTIDGNGAVINTGIKGFLQIPFACTILEWTLLSTDALALAGSIIVDIWKDTYASYPPTVADSIVAATKPTLSAVNKNTSSTLTGWTTTINAGDVLGFNVDSSSTVTKVTFTLKIQMV